MDLQERIFTYLSDIDSEIGDKFGVHCVFSYDGETINIRFLWKETQRLMEPENRKGELDMCEHYSSSFLTLRKSNNTGLDEQSGKYNTYWLHGYRSYFFADDRFYPEDERYSDQMTSKVTEVILEMQTAFIDDSKIQIPADFLLPVDGQYNTENKRKFTKSYANKIMKFCKTTISKIREVCQEEEKRIIMESAPLIEKGKKQIKEV